MGIALVIILLLLVALILLLVWPGEEPNDARDRWEFAKQDDERYGKQT